MKPILKKDFFHEKFGDRRHDPYYWMKKKGSPEVLDYLNSENEYAKEQLKSTQPLQKKIFKEIKSRIPDRYDTYPYKSGEYLYWAAFTEGKEYPIHKRKHQKTQKEEIFLNTNELAEGKDHYDLGDLQVSPNHKILAYAEDQKGSENYDIHFKNLETGKELDQFISGVNADFVWANDNKTLFYIDKDKTTLRSYRVFRYDIYSGKKEMIFEEKDEAYSVALEKTISEEYIFIGSISSTTMEWHFLPADKPNDSFTLFLKREKDHRYIIDYGEGFFYILTNKEEAYNFKLMKTSIHDLSPSAWEGVIPHNKEAYIESFENFKEFIALEIRTDGYKEIYLLNKKTFAIEKIPFPDPICYCLLDSNEEYDTKNLRVKMSSLIRPSAIYHYNYDTKKLELKQQTPMAKDFSPENYILKREFAVARDGVKIPITIVHKKDLKMNSNNPVFLEGYGAYGVSYDPNFDHSLPSLLDRGFVGAIAHVRGGAENGIKWHEQGKLLEKKNTFYDFIDAAEYLVKESYTSPDHLYIEGRSAGGLLVGSVLNERPDLFNGVIAGVPFVDVVSTMLDETLPLTTMEYEEWGNPNKKKYYDYMKSYSPYDNIKKTAYPHILTLAGYNDSRVSYHEPAKWVAKLREHKTNNNRLFLITDMKSGHFGATGRFKWIKLQALSYAFLLSLEGLQ